MGLSILGAFLWVFISFAFDQIRGPKPDPLAAENAARDAREAAAREQADQQRAAARAAEDAYLKAIWSAIATDDMETLKNLKRPSQTEH